MIKFGDDIVTVGGFWLGFGSSPTPPPTPTIYRINVPTVQHGTVSVNPTEGPTGTLVTISTVPDTGYELDTILVTGAELINGNQFYIDGSDVTVNVTFKEHASSTVIYKDDGSRHVSNWSTTVNMDTGNRYISVIAYLNVFNIAGTVEFSGDGKAIKIGRFLMPNTDMMAYIQLYSGVSGYTFYHEPPQENNSIIGALRAINVNGEMNGGYQQPNLYNFIFDTANNTLAIYVIRSNEPKIRGTAQLTFNPKLITTIAAWDGTYQGITYGTSIAQLSIKSFDDFNDALAFRGEYFI
ncbi:hypothetical protein [Ruminobacter amylophilus]|uniref:InlB B-repeat-containing protein n=1 Tax=Ruminobacter amylophilus TaxID=867 RepID=UPI0038696D93